MGTITKNPKAAKEKACTEPTVNAVEFLRHIVHCVLSSGATHLGRKFIGGASVLASSE